MPFVYSTVTPGTSTGADSTTALPLVDVNRYMRPMGNDLGSIVTGVNYRHTLPRHIAYLPFKPAYNMTLDRIGINFVNMNSCVDAHYYRLGLYSSVDNYPATLLANFGTVTIDPATPTAPGALEITGLSQVLTGGVLYWIATGLNQSGGTDGAAGRTPLVTNITGDFVNMYRKGPGSQTANSGGLSYLEQINSFGGTLPATTSFTNCQGGGSTAIRVMVRRSA